MAKVAVSLFLFLLSLSPMSAFSQSPNDDPNLWLEDVTGKAPLEWVERHDAITKKEIEADPNFKPLFDRLLAIYNSKELIPNVVVRGSYLYNFWRDAAHVRGLWRRTTLAQYRQAEPQWETVIDVDALADVEKENWVWGGASCLFPDYTRCLVSLSRGGADAKVTREFDLSTKQFVTDGFVLPESKGGLSWIDHDTVFAQTDFGPGSMTDSGYPRIVKVWHRGTPLSEAKTAYEGKKEDVAMGGEQLRTWIDGKPVYSEWVSRSPTFFTTENYRLENGTLTRLAIPDDAIFALFQTQMLVRLRTDWKVEGTAAPLTYPQGALLAIDFKKFLAGSRSFETLFVPAKRKSLNEYVVTRHALLVDELDDLHHRLVEWTLNGEQWQRRVVNFTSDGTIGLSAFDGDTSDDYFMTLSDPLTPTTLSLGHVGQDGHEVLKSLPSFFDATGMTVSRHDARSKDGELIPYLQISPKGYVANGNAPTLLYGYGGFEISMLPMYYSATVGNAWLSRGGVFVMSGIRGGGEFGPAWHQAAMKEHKQVSYDDFAAIAEDLEARHVTSPAHLGVEGGSNGGLLIGAIVTERPELFKAAVCQVPLLDMYRFNKLLAGASWMEEYGNPDDPAQWAYISKYSPYQNVRAGVKYPRVLFTTSTRDDRVHPAHARKMVAKMEAQGHDVLYYENTEGGHAGAANNIQSATMQALEYTFLFNELK